MTEPAERRTIIRGGKPDKNEPIRIVGYLIGCMLLFAVLPLPYGYYTILRISVFAGGLFLAYRSFNKNKTYLGVLFGLVAVLFNPLIPVYLSRDIWLPIDVATAILFFYAGHNLEQLVESD